MRRYHAIQFAIAGAILCTPSVHAATFCVATATALQTALDTASTNSENNTIKVQAGTYLAPLGGFGY
ncbi:MAG: hypothetical protein ABIO49_11540 [Dokdonella sp.]